MGQVLTSWCLRACALLAVCGLFSGGNPALAQAPKAPPAGQVLQQLSGPSPSWVSEVQVPKGSASGAEQSRQGIQYLLSDVQARVDGKQRQMFRHYALKALNEKGLESAANLEIRFDPAYEQLVVHSVAVHRQGRRHERLPAVEWRVVQREKELDYLIYDGSKTAHAFLDDVRVGDVVEYAYTVSGSNPVFGDRFFGTFDLQWGSPVQRLHARLLWPAGRPLNLRPLNGAPEPRRVQRGDQQELVWHKEGQEGLQLSPDSPAWYDPYAMVQWGDFGKWSDVAAWALPLYKVPEQLPAGLRAEVKRISGLGLDAKTRTAEALRWVQREVRYLGVEVGAGSHAPNPPELVFKRRFGDCKDKTLLTLTLLHHLGVPARAALVHTQQRQALAQVLPRPSAFNHVIVRAEVDGKTYWLDPTRSSQPGPLDDLGQSSYALALVVDPSTQALTAMESGPAMWSKRQVSVRLDARAGLNEAALMEVTTQVEGLSAEQMRANLSAENAAELQQRYLNYYARYYPGIVVDRPFEVRDEQPAVNKVQVLERYRVKDFFARVEAEKRLEASLEVPELLALLQSPRDTIRNAPLALPHPQDMRHEVELLLPESWTFKNEVKEVRDRAFELSREIQGDGQRLLIRDHYRSLADHVPADATAAYAANVEKARKMLGYVVYKTDPGASAAGDQVSSESAGLNLPVLLLGGLTLALLVHLALRLYRWDPARKPGDTLSAAGEPLGGLLWLLALGILIQGGYVAYGAWSAWPAYGLQTWHMFTMPGGARYHPMMAPMLLLEMVALLAQAVGWCLLALLFFKRRASAVPVYLGYMWAVVCFATLDQVLMAQIPVLEDQSSSKDIVELIRSAVVLSFWSWYVLKSERVRKTFVVRYRAESGADFAAQSPAAPQTLAPEAIAAHSAQP